MGKPRGNAENIESIITRTVRETIEAYRASSSRSVKDAFKATERRLYALPDLREKLEDDRELLAEIRAYGPRQRSKSITRFTKTGVRLTPEEIFEAVVTDTEAEIAADEHEIEAIERALAAISDDPYYQAVTGKYIDHMTDEEIAGEIHCDATTVWRNRKRLVQRLAVRLYGADALR